jgi:DNA-binding IclR family transcriptional regulator
MTSVLREDPALISEDRGLISALARGLDILTCYRRGEIWLGNNEIADRCNLPRSTVSRLTHTLTRLGYLHSYEDEARYRLGTQLIALSSSVLAGLNIRRLAQTEMMAIADASNASVGLAVRDRLSMRFIEVFRGPADISLNVEIGSRLSIASSAMGRAFLAVCDTQERQEILDDFQALDEVAWPRLRDSIDQALHDHTQIGCCCSFGDWERTVSAIAVGFRPGAGLPPMVLNCAAPSMITDSDFLLKNVRPRLTALAQSLQGVMGA